MGVSLHSAFCLLHSATHLSRAGSNRDRRVQSPLLCRLSYGSTIALSIAPVADEPANDALLNIAHQPAGQRQQLPVEIGKRLLALLVHRGHLLSQVKLRHHLDKAQGGGLEPPTSRFRAGRSAS